MTKGWTGESSRHAMARMGIKTGTKKVSTYKMPKQKVSKIKRNLLGSYSDSDAYDANKEQITERLKEEGVSPEDLDAEVERQLQDEDYSWVWEDFVENLTYDLRKKNPKGYWKVEGQSLDWRGNSGSKYFEATTGQEFVDAIAPNTQDYSIDVFDAKGSNLNAKIYHHDVPMGSNYQIYKVSEKEYNKEMGDDL